jgi:carbon monoxide dehydrogenase subunit G
MASIRREISVAAPPDAVWEALRDWGAVHERLAPGFLLDATVDGEDRIVTFFNGSVVRELFVDLDEESRRVVWAVRDGSLGLEHYNASAQVVPQDDERTRFIWIADLLPHNLASTVGQLMDQGLDAIKRTLEPVATATP